MVNNFEIIKNLLKFENEDQFYFLQIIKRKKENEDLNANAKVVKTFYINNLDYFLNVEDEIKALCKIHNARAYINLNRRSFKKIAFHLLKKITDQILAEDYFNVRNSYDSVCGQINDEKEKSWILDIDEHNPILINNVIDSLQHLQPLEIKNKLKATIPTKNGLHLITSPFNVSDFKQIFPQVDIHKNNPTLLYIYQ